jgi:hypothetical protein
MADAGVGMVVVNEQQDRAGMGLPTAATGQRGRTDHLTVTFGDQCGGAGSGKLDRDERHAQRAVSSPGQVHQRGNRDSVRGFASANSQGGHGIDTNFGGSNNRAIM